MHKLKLALSHRQRIQELKENGTKLLQIQRRPKQVALGKVHHEIHVHVVSIACLGTKQERRTAFEPFFQKHKVGALVLQRQMVQLQQNATLAIRLILQACWVLHHLLLHRRDAIGLHSTVFARHDEHVAAAARHFHVLVQVEPSSQQFCRTARRLLQHPHARHCGQHNPSPTMSRASATTRRRRRCRNRRRHDPIATTGRRGRRRTCSIFASRLHVKQKKKKKNSARPATPAAPHPLFFLVSFFFFFFLFFFRCGAAVRRTKMMSATMTKTTLLLLLLLLHHPFGARTKKMLLLPLLLPVLLAGPHVLFRLHRVSAVASRHLLPWQCAGRAASWVPLLPAPVLRAPLLRW